MLFSPDFFSKSKVRDLQKHSGAVVQSKPPEEEPKPKLPAKLSDIVCDREEFLQRSQRLPIAGVASTPAPAPAPAPVPVRPVITRPVRPLGQMALGPPVSHEEVVHLEVPHDVRILQRMEDKRRELQRSLAVPCCAEQASSGHFVNTSVKGIRIIGPKPNWASGVPC